MKVEVIGGDRLRARLERIVGGMDPKVREALDSVADKVKEDAKTMCPVDTGSLQASIRKEAVARPAGNTWEVGVRAGGYVVNPKTHLLVGYAAYVEFGTSRTRPQPYLRSALIMNAEAIRVAIATGIHEDIQESGE